MNGIDISNHQSTMDLSAVLSKTATDIVICKATEGISFIDKYLTGFVKVAMAKGCLIGIYHFARPEKNTAKAEAEFFYRYFKPYAGKAVPILDWESAGKYKVSWALEWMERVEKLTGSTPMFYTYENVENSYDWSKLTKYPLWIAKYKDYVIDHNHDMSAAGPKPRLKHWKSYVMWQWTSSGRLMGYGKNLDCNRYYGTKEDWIGWVKPTKHSRSAIVSEAQAHVGVKEGSACHHKIVDRYNSYSPLPRGYKVKYTDAWCATFISYLAIVMVYTDIIPVECSCPRMVDLAKQMEIWTESDAYRPKPGDIIMYDWDDSGKGDNAGTPDHVGIVEYLDGGDIIVIEGNYKDAVRRRTIAVNGRYIRGYITPRYDAETGGEAAQISAGGEVWELMPELKKGSTGRAVRILQIILGGLTVDGDFGANTERAVVNFQKSKGLTVDGVVGPKTWATLIKTL